MARSSFRAPPAARQALSNMRRRLKDPSVAANTADALENLDCELFLREYAEAHAALKDDPEAWADVQAERRAFDGTLMDGLHGE